MTFTFENQGTNTFLVCEIAPTVPVDSMSLGMITNNKIPGLAPALYSQRDNTKFVKYNVSAKTSASQFFAGQVNRKRLVSVLSGIINGVLQTEDYMIDVNTLLINMEYIFVDVSSCEVSLICLPVDRKDGGTTDFGAFFRNLVFNARFDQSENCDYVARLINYLNGAASFSLTDFKALLADIDNSPTKAVPQPQVCQAPVVVAPQVPVQQAPAAVAPQPQAVPPKQAAPVAPPPQPKAAPAKAPQPKAVPQPPRDPNEKKISFFGLMMHYSKENKELYKAQKEAKKQAKEAGAPAPQPAPAAQKSAAPSAKQPVNAGFAIPGQPTPPANVGFAVPGQPSQPVMQPAPAKPAAKAPTAPKGAAKAPVAPVAPKAPVMPQMPVAQPTQLPQGANFGETTVLGGGASAGETTVLGESAIMRPYLIRVKNNERILLDKPVFRIGKERSYVDYFIGDNTAISRSHANIIIRDGEYFIVDTNSTNHTYVNGEMIRSNTETKLAHGAKIMLANEQFEFLTY